MKKYLFLIVLFAAIPLAAYEAGPSGRANFGSSAQQQPAAQGYRSFTNSNNQWRQGVKTKPVQTSMAGSSATEFEAVGKKAPISKKVVVVSTPGANKPAVSTQPSSGTAAAPADANPTAMLQQVQGMMQGMQGMQDMMQGMQQMQGMMQGMQSMMGNTATGQPAAGQNAMPSIPGMPDMSALMGGMMPAAPSTAPKK